MGRRAQDNTNFAKGFKKVALVGTPNVGKSVIFNQLTGAYVTVSNYPGTTVDVVRGKGRIRGEEYEIIDTPGMYSLIPITAEERVTRTLLLQERPGLVIHVIDAKNLTRMLPMTLQLMEAGLPIMLNLNIMDEAEQLGISIDRNTLEQVLGIPVVATAAVRNRGMEQLRRRIQSYTKPQSCELIRYDAGIETALAEIVPLLEHDYRLAKRAVALLLLQEDAETIALTARYDAAAYPVIREIIARTRSQYAQPLYAVITMQRQEAANKISAVVLASPRVRPVRTIADKLSDLTMWPVTGIPILLLVLYYGLYQFVGVFGAGTLVDYLESEVFAALINPLAERLVATYIPGDNLRSLVAGEYGIITLGFRYAIAIILPIVGTFFTVFSILEDTGYLPRLAMLVNGLFRHIGLNGRAVIPIVLGFGCDTMATMVSRTLETNRERIIATLLLALAIPCSAQLGVVLGLLSVNPAGLMVWAIFLMSVFLLAGLLAARLLPGERPSFYMEIPPLRLPNFANIVTKTYTRMHWYFREVLPLFVWASVLIWLGRITGGFDWLVHTLEPVVQKIGLPAEAAQMFLFGFFRRDYGAAGLYDLYHSGALDGRQLVVAAATLTLFVPCVAQLAMMVRERGLKIALTMALFIFPFAFCAGYFLNWLILALGLVL